MQFPMATGLLLAALVLSSGPATALGLPDAGAHPGCVYLLGDDYYQVMRLAGGKVRGVIGDDVEFSEFVGVQRGNRITVHFVDTVDGSSPKETWHWNTKARTIPGLKSVKLATLKHRYHVAKRILPTCGF